MTLTAHGLTAPYLEVARRSGAGPHPASALLWLGLAIVGAVLYLASCLMFPYAACKATGCKGGKVYSPTRRAWRKCKTCGGKGSRVRLGRRWMHGGDEGWRKGTK